MSTPVPLVGRPSNQAQVNVSLEILAALREHITQIGGLLQGVSGLEELQPAAVVETIKTLQTDGIPKVDEENPTTKPSDPPTDEKENADKVHSTRKGRALHLWRKNKEALSSIPAEFAADRDEKLSFIYLKNLEENRTFRSSLIEVHNTDLLELLKETRIKSRPSYFRGGREHLSELMFSPFEDVVWCYENLREIGKNESSDLSITVREDLNSLLDVIAEDPSIVAYFETRKKRQRQIAWDHIWTLFPAGTDIVAKPFLDVPQILSIQAPPYRTGANSAIVKYDQHERWDYNYRGGQSEHWRIKAWCYDHDGRDWLRVCHEFEIKRYEGERSIDELTCYPLSSDKTPDALKEQCTKIGQRFADLFSEQKPPRYLYNDHVMIDKQSSNRALFLRDGVPLWYRRRYWGEEESIELVTNKVTNQEVVVDPEPWNERYGTVNIGKSEPTISFDSSETDMDDELFVAKPDGDRTRFCPPRFIGCLPKDRFIAQFKVSGLDEKHRVKKDDSLFKHALQLPDTTKSLLLAQVRYQKDDPELSTDIIRGKGNNLVVLLHGPPGVGKTLTAETVAQATGRPLLNTTIADVGLDPSQAERQLLRIFSVASRWQAILLIDEADAFLENRHTTAAPERNAFVTVMLRILEYHTGIVMLTTNRLTTLDPAVQSRIHLAVKYEELGQKECIKIFETSIQKSKVSVRGPELENITEWLQDSALSDQSDQKNAWNGREIRNLVTGAIAYMTFKEDESLTREHVKAVYQTTKQFKKTLEEQMFYWKKEHQGASKR